MAVLHYQQAVLLEHHIYFCQNSSSLMKKKKSIWVYLSHNKISMPNCPHMGEPTVNISYVNIIIIQRHNKSDLSWLVLNNYIHNKPNKIKYNHKIVCFVTFLFFFYLLFLVILMQDRYTEKHVKLKTLKLWWI